MNLAIKDIAYSPVRFLLTVAGLSFLVMASTGMIGLYRGIVADALLIAEDIGADLWVVQGERAGPFSESSAIQPEMDERVEGVPGVASARRFIQLSQQFEAGGVSVRASIVGLDVPKEDGSWIDLVKGRMIASSHYEAVADESLGLALGSTVRLGRDDYLIVGICRRVVDMAGDGVPLCVAQRRDRDFRTSHKRGDRFAAAAHRRRRPGRSAPDRGRCRAS